MIENEGYRGWSIKRSDHRIKLHSASQDFSWLDTTVTATCSHGCEVGFCLENHKCSCGLYSRKDLPYLLSEYSHLEIFGVVYNHGVVVEGQSGYRAEKATIRALFTSDFALGRELNEWYPGVSIMVPPSEIQAVYNSKKAQKDYRYNQEKKKKKARNDTKKKKHKKLLI